MQNQLLTLEFVAAAIWILAIKSICVWTKSDKWYNHLMIKLVARLLLASISALEHCEMPLANALPGLGEQF